MKHSEKIASAAAVISALSTLACCLPLGIAAAAGVAGLGVPVEPLRPWLIGLSIALLGVGFTRLYRSRGTCQRRSRAAEPDHRLPSSLITRRAISDEVQFER